MSYMTDIVKALSKLGMNGTANPDEKHNQGRLLGEAYLWDTVEKYAKGKSEAAWKALEKEGIAPKKDEVEASSEQEFGFSPSFVGTVKASKPVSKFDPQTFAERLSKSKYKVPVSYTKEALDDAKVEGNPKVSYNIIERS
jgi:hypothetical protein